MSDENKKAYNSLRTKKARFVIFRVEGIEVKVEYISGRKEFIADLKKRLDDLKSAIILYDYEFNTPDGRKADKMFCFSYIPENCNQTDRISTSHALKGFHAQCDGTILAEVDELDVFDDFIVKEEPDPTHSQPFPIATTLAPRIPIPE